MKKLVFIVLMICLLSVSCKSNDVQPNPEENQDITSTNTESTESVTEEDLENYLSMRKSEIITMSKENHVDGSLGIIESHMVFPCLFVEDIGLTFIFPDDSEDAIPLFILINTNSNVQKITLDGVKAGKNFKEIMGILGETDIVKTWITNEEHDAYFITYNSEKMTYTFVSEDSDGRDSEMFISLLE